MVTSYATILPPYNAYYPWHFCYLHGSAEDLMAEKSNDAPDLFAADMPMPAAGTYIVSVMGEPAIAVIAERHGHMCGRVSLISDTEALLHILNVKEWR